MLKITPTDSLQFRNALANAAQNKTCCSIQVFRQLPGLSAEEQFFNFKTVFVKLENFTTHSRNFLEIIQDVKCFFNDDTYAIAIYTYDKWLNQTKVWANFSDKSV